MESNNRPTTISAKTFNSEGISLRQNGCILPLIIGEYVPEDDVRWKLYLDLMNIVDLLFSPTTDDHATYLATLISDHHHDFCDIYSDSNVIPKMHFMMHMPRMMIK